MSLVRRIRKKIDKSYEKSRRQLSQARQQLLDKQKELEQQLEDKERELRQIGEITQAQLRSMDRGDLVLRQQTQARLGSQMASLKEIQSQLSQEAQQQLSQIQQAEEELSLQEQQALAKVPKQIAKRFEFERGQILRDLEKQYGKELQMSIAFTPEQYEAISKQVTRQLAAQYQQEGLGKETVIDIPARDSSAITQPSQVAGFKPPTIVTMPPTAGERYKQTIEGRNPFLATLSFAGQEVQSLFGKYEEKYTPNTQQLHKTGLISTGVQVAPFFIPATAPTTMLLAGAGQFTKGGREETRRTAQEWEEKYGIPAPVSQVGIYGFAGGMGILGGFGLTRQLGRLVGRPKFDTRFVTNEFVNEGEKTFLKTGAQVEEKGLIGRKQYIVGTYGEVKPFPYGDLYAGATRGVSREFGRDILTGKVLFRKPKFFWGAELTEVKPAETNLLLFRRRGLEVRQPYGEGFRTRGSGATYLSGKEPSYYVSRGGGFPADLYGRRGFLFLGKTAQVKKTAKGSKILKAGRGEQLGIITRAEAEESTFPSGKLVLIKVDKAQALARQQTQALTQQYVENIRALRMAQQMRQIKLAKETARVPAGVLIGKSLFIKPSLEKAKVTAKVTPTITKQKKIGKLTTGLSVAQIQRARQLGVQAFRLEQQQRARQITMTGLAQPQLQTPRERLAFLQSQAMRQMQRLRQRQLQTTTPTPPTTRVTPRIIGGGVIPFDVGAGARLRSILTKLKGAGVNVTTGTGKKTKTIYRNLPPFMALKRGSEYIKRNIEASFKLVKSGKMPRQKDVRAFNLGKMFRSGKKDPLRIVEKRKYRLDTPTERAQIQRARRRRFTR